MNKAKILKHSYYVVIFARLLKLIIGKHEFFYKRISEYKIN